MPEHVEGRNRLGMLVFEMPGEMKVAVEASLVSCIVRREGVTEVGVGGFDGTAWEGVTTPFDELVEEYNKLVIHGDFRRSGTAR